MLLKRFPAWSKDGNIEFTNVNLPVRRIVCPTCDGTGTHVNPSIDGNGISAEDFANDPDFAESYFGGHFDVRCHECDGRNVIEVIDEDACKTKLSWYKGMLRHFNHLQHESEFRAECDAERRMGC